MIKEKLLYTAQRVSIKKWMESGRTKVFTDFDKANAHARKLGTYIYDVYSDDGFYGWGVPK